MKHALFLTFILAHSLIPTDRCTWLDRLLPRETPEISFSWTAGYEMRDAVKAEALAQLEHYRRTGDARATSPTYNMSALHPAVLLQDVALVEKLLAGGADPARSREFRRTQPACAEVDEWWTRFHSRTPSRDSTPVLPALWIF